MALSGSTARRYAEAFLDLAQERGAVEEWSASLERVTSTLSAESLRSLAAPSYPLETRRRALEAAFANEPAGVRSLLSTLLERGRIGLLPPITRAYRDLLDARAGIEKAVITTAVPLAEGERGDLVRRLERESGTRLRTTFAVDPSLLGGMLVRIGDHQLDGSVRTRLAVMRERLARPSSVGSAGDAA